FYIQADEVVHEQYHETIVDAMRRYLENEKVEGLLFNYNHFYGSYKYIGDGRRWYSKEIRVIRNNKAIRSYRDAQGFRWDDDRKLNVKLIDAYIFHYGWVRNPITMQQKYYDFSKLWTGAGDDAADDKKRRDQAFDYAQIDSITEYKGTHPLVMKERVMNEDWKVDMDLRKKKFKNVKHRILYFLWRKFGWRPFEYSNYRRI
ncbi:MAG TPA: hypothetical protein VKH37_10070, partial [Ferruginibacter sp.]|nr:hypothetical protein [Ferruginibacter sp.]